MEHKPSMSFMNAAAEEQQSWPPSMPCTYDAADVGTEADTPARSDDGTTMEQRPASFAAPNSAAKQDKLPQQSAPDTANFLEFACNVSSVFSPPTFNTSNVRSVLTLVVAPVYVFVAYSFCKTPTAKVSLFYAMQLLCWNGCDYV